MSKGVNTLFDVLFHEVMESNVVARAHLEKRLAERYAHYTFRQRQALDEVFRELFHVSFATCFQVWDRPCFNPVTHQNNVKQIF